MTTHSGSKPNKYAARILVTVACCMHIIVTAYLWHQLSSTQRMAQVLEEQQRTDAALLYATIEMTVQHIAGQ